MAMLNNQRAFHNHKGALTFKFSYPQKDVTSIWTYLNMIWRYTPCRWGTVVLSSFFFLNCTIQCVMFACSRFCMQLETYYEISNGNWLFRRCSRRKSVSCYWIAWIHVVVSLFLPLSWHLYARVDTQTSTDIWTQGSEFNIPVASARNPGIKLCREKDPQSRTCMDLPCKSKQKKDTPPVVNVQVLPRSKATFLAPPHLSPLESIERSVNCTPPCRRMFLFLFSWRVTMIYGCLW